MANDHTTIYWSPASFLPETESWTYLYREPELLHDSDIQTYVIRSNIDDSFDVSYSDLLKCQENNGIINVSSKLPMFSLGQSTLRDFLLIQYNLNWLLFSDEPVMIKTFLPEEYLPVTGSVFEKQTRNISQWYLPVGLIYNAPTNFEHFTINSDSPLIFFQIDSRKPVVFKRFIQTDVLFHMLQEFLNIKNRYGSEMSDEEALQGILKSKMPSIVLNQIKKNIIDV